MAAPSEQDIAALWIEVRRIARQLAQHISEEDRMKDGLQTTLQAHQQELLTLLGSYRENVQRTTFEVDGARLRVEREAAEHGKQLKELAEKTTEAVIMLAGVSLQVGELAKEQAVFAAAQKAGEDWRAKEDRERPRAQRIWRLAMAALGAGVLVLITLQVMR